ncbi:ATP-binding protein [Myxococcota bacterium]
MRLAQKLILYALAVALLPLAATGFTLIRVGESALRERIEIHQRAAAVAVAAKVSQAVEELARRMETVMSLVVVTELSEVERVGVTRMLYRQSDDIGVAVLVTPDRALLGQPELFEPSDLVGDLAGHPAARTEDAARLVDRLALPDPAQPSQGSVFLSGVYFPEDGAARVAIAVPCCFDAEGRSGAFAGVEVALRRDVLRVEGVDTGPDSLVFVVDRKGRVIAHPTLEVGTDMSSHGAVAEFLRHQAPHTAVYKTPNGPFAGAVAPLGRLGWGVVVEQPEGVAFSAAAQMRRQILVWILSTVGLVLVSGLLFAARLRRVLGKMIKGARAFGEGRLGRRIDVHTWDEIGELAETMNMMAEQLESSLKELEAWSRLLEIRVEERTQELQQTSAELLTQSKLAAIGQLGAGVAHEVNNPLAGILGLAQLMLRDRAEGDPDLPKLQDIEKAAKRCKDIVMRLLRFSERRMGGRTEVDINDVIAEVLEMMQEGLEEGRIMLELQLDTGLPTIVADPGQLAQVVVNIVKNAQSAMPDGGQLTVTTGAQDDSGVHFAISDAGVGIEPEHLPRIFDPFFTTKRTWTDVGLGLSVAHRIVTDHGGTIDVKSDVEVGSTFTVALPRQPPEVEREKLPPRMSILLD